MRELADDRFYQVIRSYPDLCVDYCLAVRDGPDRGAASHREAVELAVRRAGAEAFAADEQENREACAAETDSREETGWDYDMAKARAEEIPSSALLALPQTPWKTVRRGVTIYQNHSDGGYLPYWYAFLEPPHGTSRVLDGDGKMVLRAYTVEDFQIVNQALFPRGTEKLTVYRWTTDWSDYFDAGHEWWGASCWSVYDGGLDRYVVIMASATD